MSTVESRTYTPEDLLTMPDGDRYELVDGHLVEIDMGANSTWVATRVAAQLVSYEKQHGGWAFGDGAGYQCFPFSDVRVRRPDASYVGPGRFENDEVPQGHIPIAPDLAVEVISPNDLYYDVEKKVDEYLRAGVQMVWVVNPEFRTVRIFRNSIQNLVQYGPDDVIDGDDILPGFRCKVADLFGQQESAKSE